MSYELHLGDCLDVMRTMAAGSVDAVICDPPYGISFKSNGQWFRDAKAIGGDDNTELLYTIAQHYDGVPMAMFFSPFSPPFIEWRSVLVWSKGAHVGIGGDRETCWKRDFEMIGVRDNKPLNGKRDSSVLNHRALLPPPSGHFAEKPVTLMAYLIRKLSQPGDIILDPFMGSGSTGVACIKTGRRFIGVEISEEYFKIAEKRISEAAMQLPLFAAEMEAECHIAQAIL